jgi:hypothetical protein
LIYLSIYLSIQGNPSISKPEPDGDSTSIKHAKEPKKCKYYINFGKYYNKKFSRV